MKHIDRVPRYFQYHCLNIDEMEMMERIGDFLIYGILYGGHEDRKVVLFTPGSIEVS